MPRLLFFVQVRDRVFRCDQPDMDRSLWYVYVYAISIMCLLSCILRINAQEKAIACIDAAWGVE